MSARRRHHILSAFLALFGALVFTTCAIGVDPITGHREILGYTWQQELRIGRDADAEIVRQYGLYGDSSLAAYVTGVGEKVLHYSHLRRPDAREEFRNTRFTFRVLNSPIVNAFALPGGYIYVTRGLLAHLENEAQLAVVIGHEIGHVAARHTSKRALKTKISRIGLLAGAVISEEMIGRGSGQAVMDFGGQAAGLLLLKYSRDDERQADRLGVEYAAMAGYKASDAAAFFRSLKRLGEEQKGSIPTFLSSHPDPGEREQTIVRLANEWAGRGYPMTVVNQDSLFAHIDGIIFGKNPRDGFSDGHVFYNPNLRLSLPVPVGWQVLNDPERVTMIAPKREAQILFGIARGAANPRAAASRFTSQQGVSVLENSATSVNGLTAQRVHVELVQRGTTLSVLAYYIAYRGTVFQCVGVTTKKRFASYREAFLRTMRGFNELRDANILATKPTRVSIETADRSAPFRLFLPQRLPPQVTAEDIAILNQVELRDVIERGSRIKLLVSR